MHILISNLPPTVTEEQLHQALADAGLEATVKLTREGDQDKVTAIVSSPEMDRPSADRLAAHINKLQMEGRTLRAYVPLFM